MENDTSVEVEATEAEATETSTEDTPKVETPKETPEQRVARLQRQLKRARKDAGIEDAPKPKAKEKDSDDSNLLQKAFLRTAGIATEKEVELALETAKKWDMTVDKLVDDEDFQVKLEKLRTSEANALATSEIKGGGNTSNAKNTPEYWLAKGVPPTADQVPDRKTRATIARAMMQNEKSGKKFYND